MSNCPCGRNKSYSECCGVIHNDIHPAKTAEELMRSRYSAFTLGNGDYLFKSQLSTKVLISEIKSIERWAKSVQWMKLDILNSTGGDALSDYGTVEFKAFFMEHGNLEIIHENSSFQKENGHWVYVEAI